MRCNSASLFSLGAVRCQVPSERGMQMGLMYDRNFDNGQGQIKLTNIPLDGSSTHVTQFNEQNNTRVSWEANGNLNSAEQLHFTNQNVGKHDPNRH